ncbi:hypothetical protein QQS21_008740 [Conoideocrella luteorostrata]|uniref:Cyanovirin-N domain-containing protein n=1 Tax=Conoideocrella luteorostrata TaxID=1105319 RepID=A0AAJ0FYF3_9HYPO|nr:hypothetical protein QQS21_008740 [Conoideocrella luteorostrata]
MSFANSSQNFWLDDDFNLHATCYDNEGNSHDSQINLNEFIGNSDGWFVWGGENFSDTAQEIELEGSTLSAYLKPVDGSDRERQGIDLNEKIGNENGQLVFIED